MNINVYSLLTRVIAYQGRSLNKYEKHASQVMIEIMALVYGIQSFDRILSHVTHPFIIRSDNLAVSHLNSLKMSKNPKLLRYGIFLSHYNYKLQHISANLNQMAVVLLRMPLEEPFPQQKAADEEPILGLDPNNYLGVISDDYFTETNDRQIDKSINRHRRRHLELVYLEVNNQSTQPNICALQDENVTTQTPDPTLTHTDEQIDLAIPTLAVDINSQCEDEFFADIIRYMQDSVVPADRDRARSIIAQAECYQIEDGQLIKLASYRRKRQTDITPLFKQLCLPPSLRMHAMQQVNDLLSHPTVEKCYYTLRKRYFWKSMYNDVVVYTNSCTTCMEIRHVKRSPVPMHAREVETLFSCVSLDHWGPCQTYQKSKYKYVLTISDHFSGYTLFIPAKDTSAQLTAKLFYDRWAMVHSFPLKILTDRGSSFINEFFKTLTSLTSVKHLRTAPFHPECNSAAEIRHRHLGHALRAYLKPDTIHWHSLLPSIQFAHNCLEMPGINASPFEVVYNIQPRLPIDVNVINENMETGTTGFQATFLPRFDVFRKIMTDNINDNKRRMQYYFDKKSKPHNLTENDLVYKFRDGNPSGIQANVSPKLLPRYDGPYKILQILANAAQLQRVSDGKILTAWINLNKLKPVRYCRTSLEEKYGRHRSVTPADASSDINHQSGAIRRVR